MPTKLGEFFAAGVAPITHGGNSEIAEWVRRTGSGLALDDLSHDSLQRAADLAVSGQPDHRDTHPSAPNRREAFFVELRLRAVRCPISASAGPAQTTARWLRQPWPSTLKKGSLMIAGDMANFALLGVGGFVAPRHLGAIRETGNVVIAACDPHDSVGVMDNYFPEAAFFTEVERFDRFLEKRRREGPDRAVQYVSICSPNYLHDAHVRLALRLNARAICEKPLVINPWNLDQLQSLEEEYQSRIRTVLQLRYVPSLLRLREQLQKKPPTTKKDVLLSYVTRRGRWYHHSWKGSEAKSGGLAMNIGVHLFDMMLWLFGPVNELEVHVRESSRVSGMMDLKHAKVRWFLSIDESDLPEQVRNEGGHAYRSLMMDGDAIEFSNGFQDLHTKVYQEVLAGRGHGIDDARASIELAYRVRTQRVVPPRDSVHPKLRIA